MTTLSAPASSPKTIRELLERLGNVPPERVRLDPLPGTATEDDVIRVEAREKRLCELVEGILVEKAMGYRESLLAMFLGQLLGSFVRMRNLGLLSGPDGMLRLFPGLVRIPDLAFVSWDRIPGRQVPAEPIPALVPELAIEILSEGNTPAEIERKRSEYFQAGVLLVWIVDPRTRTVMVFTPELQRALNSSGTLTGDPVLPGFACGVGELFAELDRSGQP